VPKTTTTKNPIYAVILRERKEEGRDMDKWKNE
jgi:hypothetical protein